MLRFWHYNEYSPAEEEARRDIPKNAINIGEPLRDQCSSVRLILDDQIAKNDIVDELHP